jgi:hypothetical protein
MSTKELHQEVKEKSHCEIKLTGNGKGSKHDDTTYSWPRSPRRLTPDLLRIEPQSRAESVPLQTLPTNMAGLTDCYLVLAVGRRLQRPMLPQRRPREKSVCLYHSQQESRPKQDQAHVCMARGHCDGGAPRVQLPRGWVAATGE